MKNARHAASIKLQAQARRKRQQSIPVALMAVGGMVLVLVLVIALTYNQPVSQAVQPVRVGEALSDFALTDIAGQQVRLSDYKGQVVLVNAWATWCPPCRAEMPALNSFYQVHAKDGFVILAINAGDPAADAAEFAQNYGLAFPVLLDPQTRLLDGLMIRSFPTSILIGRDGIVKDIHVGMLTPEQIDAKVGPLIQQ